MIWEQGRRLFFNMSLWLRSNCSLFHPVLDVGIYRPLCFEIFLLHKKFFEKFSCLLKFIFLFNCSCNSLENSPQWKKVLSQSLYLTELELYLWLVCNSSVHGAWESLAYTLWLPHFPYILNLHIHIAGKCGMVCIFFQEGTKALCNLHALPDLQIVLDVMSAT